MPNIDFYYDTADNTLETIIDNGVVLNQGQTNSISFRFFFKDYDTNTPFTNGDILSLFCLLNIQRPDGTSSNNVATSPNTSDTCYNLLISDWVTEKSGTLTITAKLYNAATEVTTTFGAATLQILPSATVSQDTIEDAQYQALLDSLAELQSQIEARKITVRATEDLAAGDLVTYAGTLGSSGKILVAKARASGDFNINLNPEAIFGVCIEEILNNQEGEVQTNGLINNINTNSYVEGAILYPDIVNAGKLTNTPALPPNNRMPIAISIHSHQNHGILLVRPTFFPRMSQIKDVDLTGLQVGQILRWNGTNFVAGYATGVFYNQNLPDEEDLVEYMTWFNE